MRLETMMRLVDADLITQEQLKQARLDHIQRPKGMRHDDCVWCLKVLPLIGTLQKGQE